MQKAHLYEAIFLFNHGMDEAVRGLERLKRAPDLDAATVDRTRVLFEGERADMNTHFCNNIEGAESSDASNFDKRVREIEKETLDAAKVYEDVPFIEGRRRREGLARECGAPSVAIPILDLASPSLFTYTLEYLHFSELVAWGKEVWHPSELMVRKG
jgi:hypothetical protein